MQTVVTANAGGSIIYSQLKRYLDRSHHYVEHLEDCSLTILKYTSYVDEPLE